MIYFRLCRRQDSALKNTGFFVKNLNFFTLNVNFPCWNFCLRCREGRLSRHNVDLVTGPPQTAPNYFTAMFEGFQRALNLVPHDAKRRYHLDCLFDIEILDGSNSPNFYLAYISGDFNLKKKNMKHMLKKSLHRKSDSKMASKAKNKFLSI